MATETSSVKRVPYFIDMFIWSIEYCEVRITTVGSNFQFGRNGMFNGGLPMDFAEFFHEHGVCNFCGAPVTRDLEREIADLMVQALNLNVAASDIDPAPINRFA